ncbi:hypothetical protein QBC34DRAFT_377678 [Podospora aff. communis PSN243]|uniref:Uncharacterized protein n=1 Tax=Podospora aff. communis PSN243 TaxID=3040156 RepID=A0AAV9GU53_9PEZI|nr:hypothetical protein QBC34DRAFT_377678 [Podospora aff. communis PSN243]
MASSLAEISKVLLTDMVTRDVRNYGMGIETNQLVQEELRKKGLEIFASLYTADRSPACVSTRLVELLICKAIFTTCGYNYHHFAWGRELDILNASTEPVGVSEESVLYRSFFKETTLLERKEGA